MKAKIGHTLLCLSLSWVGCSLLAVAEASQPNIIVILADDLGYGDLACYGHPRFKTPNLDRLAEEGARLTHFNTPMAFCAPTRASLLTGRYPFRSGMNGNPAPDGGPQADAMGLSTEEILLPQLLKRTGYVTAMVGKWHLGHKRKEFLPVHRGFDEYLGILYSNDMRPVQLIEGEDVKEYPLVQANLTRRYTDRALQFIERSKDKPFFLYFAQAMPHKPLAASEDYYKKTETGLYGDVIAELDWSIGQVLEKLKTLKLEEQTLVVFTSDNGPWYGGSTGGLRGMKGSSFEGGYRVPFIARWPGKIPRGHQNASPGVMMDLFATVLEVAGAPVPTDRIMDGKSLMPQLSSNAPSTHEVIFGQISAQIGTVRDARWKLHLLKPGNPKIMTPEEKWVDPRGPDGVTIIAPYEQCHPSQYPGLATGDAPKPMMLFDLQNDPGEQHDVAAEHPDVVARLQQHVDKLGYKPALNQLLPASGKAKAKKK